MASRPTKRLSRRDFLKTSSFVIASAALAACAAPAATQPAAGQPTAKPADTKAPAATTAPAAQPTPVPTAAVNNYGKADGAITIWHGLGGADGAVFATMMGMFADQNKDQGIRSELYNWDVFFQKFPTAVAAGTPPDVALFHAAEVPQMATQGMVVPMDDLYPQMGIPKDDFVKTVMDAITVNGKTMAVPFDNHGWNCYVNTKVIKDAGLDPTKLPKNGTEFIEFANKVVVDESGKHPTESGFNPDKTKVWALHFSWPRFTMPSTWFQFGTAAYDAKANKATIDSEKSTAAVQYWYDLMYKYKVVPPALPGVPGSYDIFKTNSLAIMWDGTWSLGFFKENPDVEKVTIAVDFTSLAPDGKQAQKIDSHILSIPTGVKADGVKRATTLIKWLSDNGKTWATSGQIPARLSVQKDPLVQGIWSGKAAAESFAKFGQT
ncbi:MAG TPA: twin-arginine translocation signal domain-containing protein, partial [Anaerolineae bacterium]